MVEVDGACAHLVPRSERRIDLEIMAVDDGRTTEAIAAGVEA
jgi:hypothetical protein